MEMLNLRNAQGRVESVLGFISWRTWRENKRFWWTILNFTVFNGRCNIWIRAVSSSCQEKYAKSFVWACIFEIKVELKRAKSYYFVVEFIAVLHFSNSSSINRFTSSIDALLIMYKSAISFVNSSRNNIWNLDFIRTEAEEKV